MGRKIKIGVALLLVVLALIILAPRIYFRNSNSHLAIDGRVTDDFKLYFGPGDRLLLRVGAKNTQTAFLYVPQNGSSPAEIRECPPHSVLFPPFTAVRKSALSECSAMSERYLAVRAGNALLFRTKDGHIYEVTWQAPSR